MNYYRNDDYLDFENFYDSPYYNYYPMPQCSFLGFCPYFMETSPETSTNYMRGFNPFPPMMPPFNPMPNPMEPIGNSSPPNAPPPNFAPNKAQAKSSGPSLKAIDSGAIRPCVYRFVYIWQTNGRSYWAYLVYVGKKSVSGWRWAGFRWVYFGLDLNKIDSFFCM